jgi:hypothetical protein
VGWNGTSVESPPVPTVFEDRTVNGTTAAGNRFVGTSKMEAGEWHTDTVISGLSHIVTYGFLVP